VSNHSHAAFDTHNAGVGATFQSCYAVDPTVSQLGAAHNFQDRGFRTRFEGCTSRGGRYGFFLFATETAWTGLGVNTVTLDGCYAAGAAAASIRFEHAGDATVVALVNNFTSLHGSSVARLDVTFAGRLLLSGLTMFDMQRVLEDDSGNAHVQIVGATLRYTDQASAAAPVLVNIIGSGSWLLHDINVLRRTTGSPNGLIHVGVASALPVTLGQVTWDLGATFPDLSPSSTVGASLTTTGLHFRV
jgi:hypothetical protein